MRNIGKEMERKLAAVGIDSEEKLKEAGSRHAFFQLKLCYPEVCLVHLYALEGAVQNREYNGLSEETKEELRAFSEMLKQQPFAMAGPKLNPPFSFLWREKRLRPQARVGGQPPRRGGS